jgi:hypothetical protein
VAFDLPTHRGLASCKTWIFNFFLHVLIHFCCIVALHYCHLGLNICLK